MMRGGASVAPGAVALTRMPRSPFSNARHAVSALTPRVAIDETLTMASAVSLGRMHDALHRHDAGAVHFHQAPRPRQPPAQVPRQRRGQR